MLKRHPSLILPQGESCCEVTVKLSNPANSNADPASPVAASVGRRLAGVTAVLLSVPALINAAYDIYAALAKLPRTDAERVNAELFQKYFQKVPLVEMPIPIKHEVGTVEARFLVFEEGDVFVQFGRQTQWFAFPKAPSKAASNSFSLIPSAFAQASFPASTPLAAKKSQNVQVTGEIGTISGTTLTRYRNLGSGEIETASIDIRSGRIIDLSTLPSSSPELSGLRFPARGTRVLDQPVIDLPSLRGNVVKQP